MIAYSSNVIVRESLNMKSDNYAKLSYYLANADGKLKECKSLIDGMNKDVNELNNLDYKVVMSNIESLINYNMQSKNEFTLERKKLIIHLVESEQLANSCLKYVSD